MSVDKLQRRLAGVNQKISKIEAKFTAPDDVSKYFHLGRVGADGPNMPRLNRQRERRIDATVDQAVALQQLYRDRADTEALIELHRAKPRLRQFAHDYAATVEQQIRAAGVGCTVTTHLGEVTVVSINKKTVTVETKSGHREAVEFSRIGTVQQRSET